MKPILPRRLSGGQHTKKPSAQAVQADALLRLLVAFIQIVIFFSILLARFFYLQVTQHNEFSGQASSNRIISFTIYKKSSFCLMPIIFFF